MKLMIHSPSGVEAEENNIDAVRTTLADGKPLTILPRHAPLIAKIGQKPITTVKRNVERSFTVNNGILLVAEDTVKVLTNGLVRSEPKHA